uniref:Deoxyuridine 5'-triphosphate nucleotidohydrolase n=1 Tax=Callithrix jacchus TaxID=9483 RepID=A0A8I3WPM4_CALJA
NGLLKSQLQCQLGDSHLQGWGKALQKAVYVLNQHPVYGSVSPIARIHESKVLVPEAGILPPGDTTIPLNWKLRLPCGHFRLLLPLSEQAKKGITVLAVVIDLDYQDEISLLLHNRGKEEYAWKTGDSLGHPLILPCLVIKINGKLQYPNLGRIINGPDPSGMKIWVTLPGKNYNLLRCLLKAKGTQNG